MTTFYRVNGAEWPRNCSSCNAVVAALQSHQCNVEQAEEDFLMELPGKPHFHLIVAAKQRTRA